MRLRLQRRQGRGPRSGCDAHRERRRRGAARRRPRRDTAAQAHALLAPVLAGDADMSIATFPRPTGKAGFGLVKGLARWGIARMGGGFEATAPLSGQRALTRGCFEAVRPFASGYGVEVALTVRALRAGLRVTEVPTTMAHAATGRDVSGFVHRGRQFVHVLIALTRLWFEAATPRASSARSAVLSMLGPAGRAHRPWVASPVEAGFGAGHQRDERVAADLGTERVERREPVLDGGRHAGRSRARGLGRRARSAPRSMQRFAQQQPASSALPCGAPPGRPGPLEPRSPPRAPVTVMTPASTRASVRGRSSAGRSTRQRARWRGSGPPVSGRAPSEVTEAASSSSSSPKPRLEQRDHHRACRPPPRWLVGRR